MTRVKSYEDNVGGLVYLVPVPIGNDKDITLRALEVLKSVDLICCEDTRTTSTLLKRLGITNKRLESLYSQVESKKSKEIIQSILEQGLKVAFCSDAGTPGISDPGSIFVKECLEAGIKVTSLPGASAALVALTMSGLDTSDFTFYGFLSSKKETMEGQLKALKHDRSTLIIYESPLRVLETLKAMNAILGNRKFALLRELTKEHEEAIRGTLDEVQEIDAKSIRGECVIVLEGYKEDKEENKEKIQALWDLYKENKISPSLAAKLIAKQTGIKKNEVYKQVQEEK